MVSHRRFPEGMGKSPSGGQESFSQPSDVFPNGFAVESPVSDFQGEARNILPFWVVRAEVATDFDQERFHRP